MRPLSKGNYVAYAASDPQDIAASRALRARCFGQCEDCDTNSYDARSTHVLIKEQDSDRLVCSFRLLALRGRDMEDSYAAAFYDLGALRSYPGLMAEVSRFCVEPDCGDPNILRVAWAAMTGFVDRHDVKLLFGCSSFAGVTNAGHLDAFAMLKARYLAPPRWRPGVKAPEVFRFAARLRRKPDAKKAMLAMPPLLRSYLLMGGWVSDHAVVDHQMNTLHVFTGLEIALIPETRKRLLRALV